MNLLATPVVRVGSYAAHYHGHEVAAAVLLITCAGVGVRDPRLGIVAVGLALFLLGLVAYDTWRWWVAVGRHARDYVQWQASPEHEAYTARIEAWKTTAEGEQVCRWRSSMSRLLVVVSYLEHHVGDGGEVNVFADGACLRIRTLNQRFTLFVGINPNARLSWTIYDHDEVMHENGYIEDMEQLEAFMLGIMERMNRENAEPAA